MTDALRVARGAARMAGRFAKSRSRAIECVAGGAELPVYRGHMVDNPEHRRPDLQRMLPGCPAAHAEPALTQGGPRIVGSLLATPDPEVLVA